MTKNTSKNYLSAIKAKYDIEKNGDFSQFLNSPTPVSIKDFCIDILKSSNSKTDLDILKYFFNLKGDEKDKSLIEKFDNDKFRPICNFFNGKTKKPKYELFDLMALLVDLKPRPLSSYLRTEQEGETKINEVEKTNSLNIEVVGKDSIYPNNSIKPSPTKTWLQENQKVVQISSSIFIVISLIFIYFNTKKNKNKEWIEWKNDHYEVVDWDGKTDKTYRFIRAKDDNLIQNFRKIIPCDTSSHIKNGKTCLWYEKSSNGKMEFFTALGFHPETGKTLKEVTDHIINKYGRAPCK